MTLHPLEPLQSCPYPVAEFTSNPSLLLLLGTSLARNTSLVAPPPAEPADWAKAPPVPLPCQGPQLCEACAVIQVRGVYCVTN